LVFFSSALLFQLLDARMLVGPRYIVLKLGSWTFKTDLVTRMPGIWFGAVRRKLGRGKGWGGAVETYHSLRAIPVSETGGHYFVGDSKVVTF